MLGGGFAMASYTGRWRNTKDIDFYIRHEDREKVVEALSKAGFTDYFDQLAYDRNWIYRSTRDGVIVDNIWAMANQRAQVDEHWFEHAPEIAIHGERLKVVPLEEFVWCKLYILQRDHCDWTDVMNVLFAAGTRMNWDRLLGRLEDDWPLLKALLTVYGWVCPRRARLLPDGLRRKLKLAAPEIPRRNKRDRIRLLDSRAWFAASLDPNQPLAV
jgi:predicted nucleotidyltransferase